MLTCELSYWYERFNERFFSNKLTKDIWVHFGKLPGNVLGRTKFGKKWEALEIRVSNRIKHLDSYSIIILVHEMCHVSIGGKYNHGPRFKRELERVIGKGALTRVRGGAI